jgi:RNA polymerase sigma-70 factor (ECF subfamily)
MDPSERNRSKDSALDTAAPPPDYAKAERELVARFAERVRIFAAHRLRDAAAAEDISQETLSTVVSALRERRLQNLDALPGFVFTTARNLCMHWTRSAAREHSAFQRMHQENSALAAQPRDTLLSLIDEDRRRIVRTALTNLSDDDAGLLSLLYYDGFTSDEVAARLAITAAAVRVRKHRALQRLARLLGEDADGNTTDEAGTLER